MVLPWGGGWLRHEQLGKKHQQKLQEAMNLGVLRVGEGERESRS